MAKENKNTNGRIVVRLTNGVRVYPNGEQAKGYVQTFRRNEFQLFQKNMDKLGYTILEVISDPFGLTTFVKGTKKVKVKEAETGNTEDTSVAEQSKQ